VTAGWVPSAGLLGDVRHALAHAPRSTPEDRFEAWAWRAMLDEDGPGLLTRAAEPAHVTASGIVLTPDGERTCLVLHPRAKAWVQPGGHLEPVDATVADAVAREVFEETGLTGEVDPLPVMLSRHHAPCRPGAVDWHLDVQCLLVAEPRPVVLSEESLDAAWYPVGALPDGLGRGVRESVVRAVARLHTRTGATAGA
jgi:8-oxo-dGTP pyrophosphatase MutT (NUDIX family)